jgi:ADP-heptose:LPS heptosyltransferase
MKKHTAFFINGGAGRVLCAIPALELYHKENPEDDFIVILESWFDLVRGHPLLHKRSYTMDIPNLFEEKIKSRRCISTEPYRIWEYYNQQCSLAQAFDIEINNKGIRELPKPSIHLSSDEEVNAFHFIKDVKEKTKKDKVVVFQPFGRGAKETKGFVHDSGGRSLDIMDTIEIVKKLQKNDYGIAIMSEFKMDWKERGCPDPVSTPQMDLRQWAAVIDAADHFLGIDSVGQHFAASLGTTATVIFGSTYPINTSYLNDSKIDIIDFDDGNRQYSPIRISYDDAVERNNDRCLTFKDKYKCIDTIVKSVKTKTGVKAKK